MCRTKENPRDRSKAEVPDDGGDRAAPAPRRRGKLLVAAMIAIVVIAGSVVVVFGRGGGGKRNPAASPTSSVNPTTGSIATTTTTAGAPEPVPECAAANLSSATATDRRSYSAGATVTVSVTVRNISPVRCQTTTPFPQTFASAIRIVDANGTLVWSPAACCAGIPPLPTPQVLAPGQSYVWATVEWNQHFCTATCTGSAAGTPPGAPIDGGPVPPGDYMAAPNAGSNPPSRAAPATFAIAG
ncbi:MAG: hypothetical protein QOK39_1991 [Acidimicrobiaceae bacterium]|jgi:hypothetical protein|nr:hypothetical protein [Acidimicrobiaceae bacterium]